MSSWKWERSRARKADGWEQGRTCLEVAVDDGRVVRMQVDEPLQDLPRPSLEHDQVCVSVFPPILSQGPVSEELGDLMVA